MEEKPFDNPYEPPGAESKPMEFGEEISAEEKQWAMFAHLSALSGYVVPFGWIIGPLIVWMMKKDEMPFVDEQGKESLNFQISILIYSVVGAALICAFIGFFVLGALVIFQIVYVIIAAVQANKGEQYRYPLTIRIIN